MSIRLMSDIFDAAIPDMVIEVGKESRKIEAHVLTLILLALADHANDDGKGAYPATNTLASKTKLNRTTVIRSLNALKKWNYIEYQGVSEYGTSDYTVHGDVIRASIGGVLGTPLLVSGGAPASVRGTPESSFNHPLTSGAKEAPKLNFRDPEWDLLHGKTPETLTPEEEYRRKVADVLELFARTQYLCGLLLAFIDATQIFPTKSDVSAWTKALGELYAARLIAPDITEAVKRMRKDKLTIADPFSVKKVAIDVHALRMTTKPVKQEEPAFVTRMNSGNYVKPSQLKTKVDA